MSLRHIVVYVAGPFRARVNPNSQWEQERNIRAAEAMALDLWALGFTVISPHLNTRNFQGELPDHVWMKGDLELLRRSDAALFLQGWNSSDGSKMERNYCQLKNIPIFDSPMSLYQWAAQRKEP